LAAKLRALIKFLFLLVDDASVVPFSITPQFKACCMSAAVLAKKSRDESVMLL
jgi:hypothetical protein